MIILPEKFNTENKKGSNKPALIVELQSDIHFDEQHLQADWTANNSESNIDYATQVGAVILDRESGTIDQLTKTTAFQLPPWANYWQSFVMSENYWIDTIGIWLRSVAYLPLEMTIWSQDKTVLFGTGNATVSPTNSGYQVDVPFNNVFLPAGYYWFKADNTYPNIIMHISVTSPSAYPGGEAWIENLALGTWEQYGDLYFDINFSRYIGSGHLLTKDFDLEYTPIQKGEWVFDDVVPGGTALTYEAWAVNTDTLTFPDSWESLGAVIDGDPITTLTQYYRVDTILHTNSKQGLTPALNSIIADFATYTKYATHPKFGYEVAVMEVPALETEISDFDKSTIGQLTIQLEHTPSVSNWLATKKPKNKIVKVLAGFVAADYTKDDFINYFWGQIDDYSIGDDDTVSISIKDFSTEWDKNIPETWAESADNVFWQGSHHVDVMLDILQNHINVRDSKLDFDSFIEVFSDTYSYGVDRIITANPENGEDLLDELRLLLNAYFIPQPTGRVKLKRLDPTETVSVSITPDDMIKHDWESNAEELLNKVSVYFDWTGSGDNAEDYNVLYGNQDSDSMVDYQEIVLHEVKDRWTPGTNSGQIAAYASNILARYTDPPPLINASLDRRYIYLEAGDLINVTTQRAPKTVIEPSWSIINSTTDAPGRYDHGTTVVDSVLYTFGGVGSGTNMLQDLWSYDPSSDLWTAVGTHSDERRAFGIAAINDDIYFSFGQSSDSPFAQRDLFKYNVTSDIWTAVGTAASGVIGHHMFALGTDLFIVAGFTGFDYQDYGWKYDTVVDTWTEIATLDHRQNYSAAANSYDAYIYGGMWNAAASIKNDLWKFNGFNDTWTLVGTGPVPLYDHDAIVVSDTMYIYGGRNSTGLNNTVWAYNITDDTWIEVSSGATPRGMHSMTAIGRTAYIFGGIDESSAELSDLWKYNPTTYTEGFDNIKMQIVQKEIDFMDDVLNLKLKKV